MRLFFLRSLYVCLILQLTINNAANSQSCIPTNINNTIITRTCAQSCADILLQVPDIKGTDDYVVNTIPYNPYPFDIPGSNELTSTYADDTYSAIINLPFTLCFYGGTYNQCVVGSNGLITFDLANASCGNAYNITQPLPYAGGVACGDLAQAYYPRASIMGLFTDLDPQLGASGTDRKIAWHIEGTAPCRKFIVNFYQVGMYGAGLFSNTSSCNFINPTTFQMVVHEATDLVEVFIERKRCTATPPGSQAIIGVQNWDQTQAVWAPGKNSTIWQESNTAYRFTPSGTGSRFISAELLDMTGTLVSTATATPAAAGFLDINFPNICVASASTQFVVQTKYSVCSNPATQVVNLDTITINRAPADFAPTITPQGTACAGSNSGSVQISPTAGTSPYTFVLNPGALTQTGATANFTGLAAGAYTLNITDALGCVNNPITITITSGAGLTTSVNKTDVLCNGGNTGTITVTQPTVGTPPFEYSINGVTWQASNTFTGLAAGTYTVYYRESSGCQGSQPITITQPAALTATLATVPVVCNGQNNGMITVSTGGGVTPYEYSINGGVSWQPNNIFNVVAGTYTISIRDANGCITTQMITVTEPPVLTAISANSAASCDGGNDGVITVTANGGNPGYQYSLDAIIFQSSNTFNVGPGNYTVTVRDNLGCITSFQTTVVLGSNFSLTPQIDPTICEGRSTPLALVSNATQYAWTPATGLSSATIYNPIASPTVTTQYIVTATLGRCSGSDTVIVNVNAAPVPNAGADGFICYGQTYQLQASGGTQYSWSPVTYLDNAAISNPLSTPLKDIVYTLSIVSDLNGCASLVTDQVSIDVTPPIKVKTYPYDTVAYNGDQFIILAIPSDTDVVNYSWTPSLGLSDPTIRNPIVTAGAVGDVVQYQVITSTPAGCRGEGFVTVRVYKGPDIYVPTGFTPNGDGRNDRFTPFPVGIKSFKYFRVFNRWGELVFSTSKLHEGWDGKMQGKVQPTGVYVWMIEGTTKDDKPISKKGTVTIIQ